MITKRKDGTFIVDHNGMPYHVVSKEIDPYNAYDIEEIRAYAEAHPDEVQDEPEPDTRAQEIRALQDYLDSTDWYVVRFSETGKAIPQDVLDERQAARDKISDLSQS